MYHLLEEQALFLTHTDVDNTGKSYYGETNLYLVSLDGSFDGMVDLGGLRVLSSGQHHSFQAQTRRDRSMISTGTPPPANLLCAMDVSASSPLVSLP